MIGISTKIPSRKKLRAKVRLTVSRRHRNNNSISLARLDLMQNLYQKLNVLGPLKCGPEEASICR